MVVSGGKSFRGSLLQPQRVNFLGVVLVIVVLCAIALWKKGCMWLEETQSCDLWKREG